MRIIFYMNIADDRQVDKTNYITQVTEYNNVIFKDDNSIMTPSVIIHTSDISFINKVNYVFIEELNSYYFITDINCLSGTRYEFNLDLDVLMTNKDDIKNLTAVIARQENTFNQYLDDPEYKVYNYERIQTYEFPQGLTNTNPTYVLAVAGGE